MFFFSRFFRSVLSKWRAVLSVFLLSGTYCFCLSPKGVSAWTGGNRKIALGLYGEGEALLKIALSESKKSQSPEVKNRLVHVISNDLAACLEKRGRHEEAARFYRAIVELARRGFQEVQVHHVSALRGLIRCHLVHSLPTSELVELMDKWHPQVPASYFVGSTWFLMPFCSSFSDPEPSVVAFLSDFFNLNHSQAKELLTLAIKSPSHVLFFEIGENFLTKLNSFGKSFSMDFLVKDLINYTKGQSPVMPPYNQDAQWVSKHTCVAYGVEPRWIVQWKMLSNSNVKPIQKVSQLELLMTEMPMTTPFKEVRARFALERGILCTSLGEDKMARDLLLQASRSDQYGPTRTTASAMGYILGLAVNQKDINLCRKAFRRAERLYLFSPKLLTFSLGNLFVESAEPRLLEGIVTLIQNRGGDLAGWSVPPKGLILSASGSVLFWEGFEDDIVGAPKLKTAVNALKILSGNGFFGNPKKGWLADALLGQIQDDDI
ncbi:tetratricopeptide repeat protein [Candidatus Similichlamydia laticola]|uniref:Uncharacterized protein n=1 Tax=Candidatus Similichlamydia laticola TaxID=2170265 RepID=A0A369KKJ5_9BACT|nr:tetratricopeptide repeat protein [Candidatus Similichlamydia laticola]RDB31526.1 hypothetical protein HAT2_00400 [Candidatus Similichlamydia laticola]